MSESPTWVTGSQLLESSVLLPGVYISRKLELEPVLETRHGRVGCSIMSVGLIAVPNALLKTMLVKL